MNTLEVSEAEAAAVQKTPHRVTLESLYALRKSVQIMHPVDAPHVTICAMTLKNGFVLVGHSAPADPANFDPALGVKIAEENCISQMWPLEGYRLRCALSETE